MSDLEVPRKTAEEVTEMLFRLFARHDMYGAITPEDFLHMLTVVGLFLDRHPPREFHARWSDRLGLAGQIIPSEKAKEWGEAIEEMQDEWFEEVGLEEDHDLVRRVWDNRERRRAWRRERAAAEATEPEVRWSVEIGFGIQVEPTARCMDCEVEMEHTAGEALHWFQCPKCGEWAFETMGNVRRDAGRAFHDPTFRSRTWKAPEGELPFPPPPPGAP